VVVFDVPREPEADGSAKIASIEDDSFGKNDAGMRFGSRDWIANRASFNFEEGAALDLRVHTVEDNVIGDAIWPVYFGPCPGKHTPRAAGCTSNQGLDCGPLSIVRELIDENDRFTVTVMNRARPTDVYGKVQAV